MSCSVCDHPEREAIHAALSGPDALSINATAARFGVAATTLRRHLSEAGGSSAKAPGVARSSPGRPCLTCAHPQREAIDRILLTEGGVSRAGQEVASCPDRRSLRRHRDHCLGSVIEEHRAEVVSGIVSTARERAEALHKQASSLLKQAHQLVRAAKRDGDDTATRAKALQAAAAVVGRAAPIVELLARMSGELRPGMSVNVILASPEFARVLEALVAAVRPFGPEALAAVADAMQRLEAGRPLRVAEPLDEDLDGPEAEEAPAT